ncbi:MAG: transposase [Candidatus Omnitrophica bacterium]|nr:transposase [Candidatus Omnitrophota bacterium]
MNRFCLASKTSKPNILWGIRRVWSYLKFRENITVNRKRIYRLMKEHNLLVTKATV